MASQTKLLDQLRAVLRRKHYSHRTEESYDAWVIRFIRFHQLRHPRDLGPPEIAAFLTHLAVVDQVAASTQNQARSALLFSTTRCWASISTRPPTSPLRSDPIACPPC